MKTQHNRARFLIRWDADDLELLARTGEAGAFARGYHGSGDICTSVATAGELVPAVENQPRFTVRDGRVGLLLEGGPVAQIVVRGTELSDAAWSNATGSETTSAGQSDCLGGTKGVTLGGGGNVASARYQTVTATDGTQVVVVLVKGGTSGKSSVSWWDDTALVARHRVDLAWVGGVPTPTTLAGAGTLFAVEALAGSYNAVAFSVEGVVGANVNRVLVYPDTAAGTGDVTVCGVMAGKSKFPTSFQPSKGAVMTRYPDTAYLEFASALQALTFYVRWRELAPSSTWNNERVFTWSVGTSQLYLYRYLDALYFAHENAAGTVTASRAASVVRGQLIEARCLLALNGSVSLAVAIDGGAENESGFGSALILAASGAAVLYMNSDEATGISTGREATGYGEYETLRVAEGIEALYQMRDGDTLDDYAVQTSVPRLTESGVTRITESGVTRMTEGV